MSNAQNIKATYDDSLMKIQKVLYSQDATADQKEIAEQSLRDLTTTLLLHNLKTIEGRTAILSSLIVELQEVIDSVKVENPLTGITNELSAVITHAKDLFKDEKQQVVKKKVLVTTMLLVDMEGATLKMAVIQTQWEVKDGRRTKLQRLYQTLQ